MLQTIMNDLLTALLIARHVLWLFLELLFCLYSAAGFLMLLFYGWDPGRIYLRNWACCVYVGAKEKLSARFSKKTDSLLKPIESQTPRSTAAQISEFCDSAKAFYLLLIRKRMLSAGHPYTWEDDLLYTLIGTDKAEFRETLARIHVSLSRLDESQRVTAVADCTAKLLQMFKLAMLKDIEYSFAETIDIFLESIDDETIRVPTPGEVTIGQGEMERCFDELRLAISSVTQKLRAREGSNSSATVQPDIDSAGI